MSLDYQPLQRRTAHDDLATNDGAHDVGDHTLAPVDAISSRRLSPVEIRQLSASTAVSFERRDGGVVVVKRALDAEAAKRLRHEAAALASVHLPNVVRLRSISDDELPTMVTEFAGRATVATLLPDDVATVARLCASLCATVDELHRSGWGHGAITADHCIIGPTGRVMLCSFSHAASSTSNDELIEDRAAVAQLGEDLLDALDGPSRRRDRADRRVVRRQLRAYVGVESGAAAALMEVAKRRSEAGVKSSATTRPGAARSGPIRSGPLTGRSTASGPIARRGVVARRRARSRQTGAAPTRGRALAASIAALVALLAAIELMRRVGGPLQLPEFSGPNIAGADRSQLAVDLVVVVLRIAAFGAALYGIVLCAATILAIVTGRADVARVATSMASPRVRAALVVILGIGTVAGAASTSLAAEQSTAVAHASATQAGATVDAATGPDAHAIGLGTAGAVDGALEGAGGDIARAADAQAAGQAAPAATMEDTWTVERGDHLWGIAEQVMVSVHGAEVEESVVAAYWLDLIEINRGSLIDPDNPDLIHVGQVFVLPPV